MLSVTMLSVIVLSVFMMSVIMLSAAGPNYELICEHHKTAAEVYPSHFCPNVAWKIVIWLIVTAPSYISLHNIIIPYINRGFEGINDIFSPSQTIASKGSFTRRYDNTYNDFTDYDFTDYDFTYNDFT